MSLISIAKNSYQQYLSGTKTQNSNGGQVVSSSAATATSGGLGLFQQPVLGVAASAAPSSVALSSDEDEVFMNSRLDVCGGPYSNRNGSIEKSQSLFLELEAARFTDLDLLKDNMSPLFTPMTPNTEQDAIIFTIYFCGKYFGELGLFEPDVSVLDWNGFKFYIFSSLNLEHGDSFVISYSEGSDKLKIPIQTEAEYNEALKIAKEKSLLREKFFLNINRSNTGFPRSLRSLVSSSLKKVNSSGYSRNQVALPETRSVMTSTSMSDIKEVFERIDIRSMDGRPPPMLRFDSLKTSDRRDVLSIKLVFDFDTEDNKLSAVYNLVNETCSVLYCNVQRFDKQKHRNSFYYDAPKCDFTEENKNEVSFELNVKYLLNNADDSEAPTWFKDSISMMRQNMTKEISCKMTEGFQEFFGGISDIEVEEKLKRIIDTQDKNNCCCKGPICSRQEMATGGDAKRRQEDILYLNQLYIKEEQEKHIQDIKYLEDLKTEIEERQGDIFNFLSNSNEVIKQKVLDKEQGLEKLLYQQDNVLRIEEREKVLSRIENCSQRSRVNPATTAICGVNNIQKALNSFYNAKFCEDITYPDGSKVYREQKCSKTWLIRNSGSRHWKTDVKLMSLDESGCIEIQCPPLLPGEEAIITASFIIPNECGLCMKRFGFVAHGESFGDILWSSVQVVEPIKLIKPTDQNSENNPSSNAFTLRCILRLLVEDNPDLSKADNEDLKYITDFLIANDTKSFESMKNYLDNQEPHLEVAKSNEHQEEKVVFKNTVNEIEDNNFPEDILEESEDEESSLNEDKDFGETIEEETLPIDTFYVKKESQQPNSILLKDLQRKEDDYSFNLSSQLEEDGMPIAMMTSSDDEQHNIPAMTSSDDMLDVDDEQQHSIPAFTDDDEDNEIEDDDENLESESEYVDSHSEQNESDDDAESVQSEEVDEAEIDRVLDNKLISSIQAEEDQDYASGGFETPELNLDEEDDEDEQQDKNYEDEQQEKNYEEEKKNDDVCSFKNDVNGAVASATKGINFDPPPVRSLGERTTTMPEIKRGHWSSSSVLDKKPVSSLQENFKQNVDVKLDFEVIAKPTPLQTSASTSAIPSLSQSKKMGPLTFREQHFTTSGCSVLPPPPKPIIVPESDDEFDGVFVHPSVQVGSLQHRKGDEAICSSVSESKDDDSNSSMSSFSECEDEDLPEPNDERITNTATNSSRGIMPDIFSFLK